MLRAQLLLVALALQAGAQYDVLIRDARIVDGTGNPWFRADVAVAAGKIAALGRFENAKAARVIDAKGRVLVPGFIDVHTHIERAIAAAPAVDSFLHDGVTTVVTGNCGNSVTNIAAFLDALAKNPAGVNVASLIGHGSVRSAVLGMENRAPTPEELNKMRALVVQAMRDGAVGLSTGLWYAPGNYARTEEIIHLARAAAPFGGVYATHMRDEGPRILPALEEAIRIGEASGLRVQISHLKIGDRRQWGTAPKVIALLNDARRRGLDIAGDQYPYNAGSTGLQPLFPRAALAGGEEAVRERLTNPASRARIAAEIEADPEYRFGFDDYSFARVAFCPWDRALEGRTISEINLAQSRKPTLKDEIQTVLDLRARGDMYLVYRTNGEDDMITYMRWPHTAVASDAIYVPFGEGVPHPRNYGTNARVLARFVREKNVLTLEDAIRRMTSLPARTFGFLDRGLIRQGFIADIVLLDPEKVTDNATYEKPHQFSTGIDWVFVNGVPVIEEGKRNPTRPGRPVRRTE
jgi:N-acyl-D-amino-acid deacylase